MAHSTFMAVMKPRDIEQRKEGLGNTESRLGFAGKPIPRICDPIPVILGPCDL